MNPLLTDPELKIIWMFFIFLVGLAFGSFANVLIRRLPRGESIIKPPSHCPSCKETIKFYDNIPLFSYINLRARCRYCGIKIPFRYFIVELLTGCLFLALFLKFGFSILMPFYTVFAFVMLVHAFIDFDNFLLLDRLNISLGIIGILMLILFPQIGVIESIVGSVFGGGLLLLAYFIGIMLFKKKGMGFGDIKTAVVCGFFLGPVGIIYMLIISAFIGLFWGVSILLLKRENKKIPFGVMMATASIIVIFLKNYFDRLLY